MQIILRVRTWWSPCRPSFGVQLVSYWIGGRGEGVKDPSQLPTRNRHESGIEETTRYLGSLSRDIWMCVVVMREGKRMFIRGWWVVLGNPGIKRYRDKLVSRIVWEKWGACVKKPTEWLHSTSIVYTGVCICEDATLLYGKRSLI